MIRSHRRLASACFRVSRYRWSALQDWLRQIFGDLPEPLTVHCAARGRRIALSGPALAIGRFGVVQDEIDDRAHV